jgi:hypothetical protein
MLTVLLVICTLALSFLLTCMGLLYLWLIVLRFYPEIPLNEDLYVKLQIYSFFLPIFLSIILTIGIVFFLRKKDVNLKWEIILFEIAVFILLGATYFMKLILV